MAIDHSQGAVGEFKAHWTVLIATVAGVMLSSVVTYTIGAYIEPLEAEFGWARADISLGMTIQMTLGAMFGPFLGMLVDRVGPRRVGIPGAALFLLGVSALSLTQPAIWTWWGLWFLLGIGGLFIKPTTWTAAIGSLFDRGRGMAMAIALCGTGLASSTMPFLNNWLIAHFGWRSAFVVLAGILALVNLPLIYFFLNSARDIRRRSREAAAVAAVEPAGMTAREAFLSLNFLKLAVAAFVFTIAAIGLVVNLLPVFVSTGIPRTTAALIAGLMGITSIVGRICTGYLLDRFPGHIVGGVCVAMPVLSCLCLVLAPGSVPITVLAVLVLGLTVGAEVDVVAYLATRYFGMFRYGTIFGAINSLWLLASGFGPMLVNRVYDVNHTYAPAIWAMMPAFVLASILLLSMGRYPVFALPQDLPGRDEEAPAG